MDWKNDSIGWIMLTMIIVAVAVFIIGYLIGNAIDCRCVCPEVIC